MSLLVYALCRTGSLDPSALPPGLDGKEVYAICTEQVAGLFSELGREVGKASDAEFDAFDRVIEAAHEQGPALPVRFGTVYSDDALLSRAIRLRSFDLERQLARVDGMVELNVTLTGSMARTQRVVTRRARVASPEPVHATHGSSAVKTARPGSDGSDGVQREASEDIAIFCRTRLAELCEIAREVEIEGATALRSSGVMRCLVAREDVPAFEHAFAELQSAQGFEGRLGTPSPCYAFATQTLA